MQDNVKTSKHQRTIYILIAIGLTAGVLGGLLGIGGGALVVPALVFFLAFGQHRAHGTSLAVVLALSLAGVVTYSCHQHIDLLVAAEIAAGGVLGAIAGGNIVQLIKSKVLRRMFSLFLVAVGAKMILDGWSLMHQAASSDTVDGAVLTAGITVGSVLLGLGTGALTGFLSAILGVGGGIVMVPMLTVLLHFPQQQAQGISLAAMMPIAFTGMLKHRKLGNVEFRVAEWVSVGAVVGAIIGSSLANAAHASILKLAFGIFLIIMAALMAAKRR